MQMLFSSVVVAVRITFTVHFACHCSVFRRAVRLCVCVVYIIISHIQLSMLFDSFTQFFTVTLAEFPCPVTIVIIIIVLVVALSRY